MFTNKIIAITGGTGSFGQHMAKFFTTTDIKEIRIFSRDETKQDKMRFELNDKKIKFYIGDVRDYNSVYSAFKGVDYVYHAAALKQVPSCEFFPIEAVKTNILGADNVMSAAIARKVKKIILLSTDKTVYPVSAMGHTKALMEKTMMAKARMMDAGETILCATRYGNLMESRGSVIPLFVSQLKQGKEITVTDYSMTRFLMSLDDSVELVLHAFKHAGQGDIFIQKAPYTTVKDLIQALKEIFHRDNPVKVIGIRHGEKLFESLISQEEIPKLKDMGKYYRIPADQRGLNYSTSLNEILDAEAREDDYSIYKPEKLSIEKLKKLLITLNCVKSAL